MRGIFILSAILALVIATPLMAKDSLGVFDDWGAFRDPQVPRCYAIAAARGSGGRYDAYASVGTWPKRKVRGQVHFRLSRTVSADSAIVLRIGQKSFTMTGGGADAWATDRRMDAAIVAAMRSAGGMSLGARARDGKRFTDSYSLAGAATAMDAAAVGCARA